VEPGYEVHKDCKTTAGTRELHFLLFFSRIFICGRGKEEV